MSHDGVEEELEVILKGVAWIFEWSLRLSNLVTLTRLFEVWSFKIGPLSDAGFIAWANSNNYAKQLSLFRIILIIFLLTISQN